MYRAGRALPKYLLDHDRRLLHLPGRLIYSIQTNAADWNRHVVALYQSFGFEQVAHREYPNRTDAVLRLITAPQP